MDGLSVRGWPSRAAKIRWALGTVIWHVTMSLDGFIAAPNDAMDWAVARRSEAGATTGDVEVERSAIADEVRHSAGAILGGRRWYDVAVRQFDGYDGIYGGEWTGPVFVLTRRAAPARHHPSVTFLSTDLPAALAQAKDAADGKDVVVFGANLAAQCLAGGLLDELVIHMVPVLLGAGTRLELSKVGPLALERTRLSESGQITDLRFAVRYGR